MRRKWWLRNGRGAGEREVKADDGSGVNGMKEEADEEDGKVTGDHGGGAKE